MKAIIFNSGIGKRMGELTKNNHKSMVKLHNGETIFERQIRLLSECGIKEFVITTGLYEENFKEITDKYPYNQLKFTYVNNPIYDKTNYIYSFYLARPYLNDDFLMLHGDLVFNKKLAQDVINCEFESCVTIDKTKPLPEKDFKGRLIDDLLKEVSINIFDKDCYALQPFYKLSKKDINIWMDNVVDFIENRGINSVYAENAMNEVSDKMNINFFDASGDFVEEIDNLDDYKYVTDAVKYFDYKEQVILYSINEIKNILKLNNLNRPFVVITNSMKDHRCCEIINECSNPIYFSNFKPNPVYEDVLTAINLFKENKCDSLISIGGGSAIDTAKAVKMFLPLDDSKTYIGQDHKYINLKHIAVPTTAGTGSESTRFSVIYYNGNKQSLTNDSIIPEYAILDSEFLNTLPEKQKASTLFDALCQAIESLWSVHCNKQSQEYAKEAIHLILENFDSYFNGKNYNQILKASNLAGKAINITQTTAAHAMSYKLTSNFGIPHGQAVAICIIPVWKKLLSSFDDTTHPLGKEYLENAFNYLKEEFNAKDYPSTIIKFEKLVKDRGMLQKVNCSKEEFNILVASVNADRLKNFPLMLNKEDITSIYNDIVIINN